MCKFATPELNRAAATMKSADSFQRKGAKTQGRKVSTEGNAGIKARSSGNEKREEKPRLADSLQAAAQTIFGK
jgi:hypothetical protein